MFSTIRGRLSLTGALIGATLSLGGCNSNSPFSLTDVVFFSFSELTIGTGPQATIGDLVAFSYVSWIYVTDQSDNKGQQLETADVQDFFLGTAKIRALDEGLRGMRVGGRRRLVVPANLAFSQQGTVPLNAALVVEMEVTDIRQPMTDTAPFQIIDLTVGTGTEVGDGDTLNVTYAGWLYSASAPDGKGPLFEVSSTNGIIVTVGVGQVIPGWDMGLPGMLVGGERRLIIPPELAYGDSPPPNSLIPANATLLFDITLIAVQ